MELDDGLIIFSEKEKNISDISSPLRFDEAFNVANGLEDKAVLLEIENDCDASGLPMASQLRRRHYAVMAGQAISKGNFGISLRAIKQIVSPEYRDVQKRIDARRTTVAELQVMAGNLRNIYQDEFDSLVEFNS